MKTADGVNILTTMATGGTGQAIRVAAAYNVPVFNLATPETLARVQRKIDAASPLQTP